MLQGEPGLGFRGEKGATGQKGDKGDRGHLGLPVSTPQCGRRSFRCSIFLSLILLDLDDCSNCTNANTLVFYYAIFYYTCIIIFGSNVYF